MKTPRDLPARRCVRAFGRLGFKPVRQRGSHLTMHNPTTGAMAVIPMHGAIRVGTLEGILEDAGLTLADLLDAL